MASVVSVNISERKGEQKHPVPEIQLKLRHGIVGDAHAGDWHRQISLLAEESVDTMRAACPIPLDCGVFAENINTEGIDLKNLPVGTRLRIGQTEVEVTQIGKECHSDCAIKKAVGRCVMPTEGIFAVVVREGVVRAGDEIEVIGMKLNAAVVTVSDRSFRGERPDEGGPVVAGLLEKAGYEVVKTCIVPDEQGRIEAVLRELADSGEVQLLVTTGGTGMSPRDVTPEATLAVCQRMTPGIPEAMRYASMRITPRGMLSRAQAGIRGGTLIVNVPGSPRAAKENLEAVLPTLAHGLEVLSGRPFDCAKLEPEKDLRG